MKKIISLLALVALFISCNKDLVEKPNNLIDKKKMGDILYDMSILDAIKYQNPDSLFANGINPKTYIYKKYKIDSLQFAKSSAYYASDYREYKNMYDALSARLKKEKSKADLIIKKEVKKAAALKKAKEKKVQDSIKKAKKDKELKIKKEKDSIAKKKQDSKVKK
jgi:tRNA nucleotidyltransferase/poly(A) polymerase